MNDPPILSDLETLPLIHKKTEHEEIIDLDDFFSNLYDYYLNKGFYPSIFKKIIHLIQYTSLIAIFLLFNHIDLDASLSNKQLVITNMSFSFINTCILLSSFIGFVMISLSSFKYIYNMYTTKQFYNNRLKLNDEQIINMYWTDIVKFLIDLQSREKFYKMHSSLSEFQITNHIMRIDNILIALIQKNIITTSLFIPIINYRVPYLPKLYLFCIKRGIIDSVFNQRKQLDITSNIELIIINKLTVYSIGIIIFSPFILIILSLFFVFRYFDEFRQNKYTTIRTRKWSRYSRWLFRKPNELYHVLHKRLSIAYIYADMYIQNFSNELLVVFSRFIAFICGTLLVTLLTLSFIDEDFIHIHVYNDKTVMWFIGVCGIILSLCRVTIKDEYHLFTPEKYIKKVIQYTQYYPSSWQNELHTAWVKNDFTLLFQHKMIYIFEELSSIIIVPYLLYYKVKYEVGGVVKFFIEHVQKDRKYNLGYVYVNKQEVYQNLEQSVNEEFINLVSQSRYIFGNV